MAGQIPLVDYLVLTATNHTWWPRNARTAAPGSSTVATPARTASPPTSARPIATEGTVRAFTIVAFAAPGIPTPFVAAVVDCGGTQVRANLVNVEPDAEHVHDGMKVRLATQSIGTDSEGTEAIGFGFEPVG